MWQKSRNYVGELRRRLGKQLNFPSGRGKVISLATVYSYLRVQIEKEEEKVAQQDPDKQCFHLCIVNLVIGTLYCAKVRA